MKEKLPQREYTGTTNEILYALAKNQTFIKLLNTQGKPYKQLLNWLLEIKMPRPDLSINLPTIKEIAKELQLDSQLIAKHARLIYNNIFELNDTQPELFCTEGQKLCFLSFKHYYGEASINLGLEFIPRKDEEFNFYFVKPLTGGSSFYVKSVDYFYANGRQEICIYLGNDRPNNYLELLKEKALLRDTISLEEFHKLKDYELEEKLIKLYSNL